MSESERRKCFLGAPLGQLEMNALSTAGARFQNYLERVCGVSPMVSDPFVTGHQCLGRRVPREEETYKGLEWLQWM